MNNYKVLKGFGRLNEDRMGFEILQVIDASVIFNQNLLKNGSVEMQPVWKIEFNKGKNGQERSCEMIRENNNSIEEELLEFIYEIKSELNKYGFVVNQPFR